MLRWCAILVSLCLSIQRLSAQPVQDTLPFICMLPVATEPHFPGGDDSLINYVKHHLRWPSPDWDGEGVVYVRFKVDCKGTISEATAIRGLDSLANREALRVINTMPKWVGGNCDINPAARWFNLPVRFRRE